MMNPMTSPRPQTMPGAARRSSRAKPGRMRPESEAALFLARWLKAPQGIGSLAPSSQHLARAMARQIDPRRDRLVVELGGGTGSITRALLETGLPPDRLIVVERDPALYAHLRERFPHLRILRGDATQLVGLLRSQGITRVDRVVSSLPLLSMAKRMRQRIVDQSFALLGDHGALIQYTYGVASPLAHRDYCIVGQVTARVWRNFPPATVWRFHRAAGIAKVA